MQKKMRKAARAQREQLLTLINGWDPAGLLAGGAPRDTYDRIIDPLFGLLAGRASRDEVAQFLDNEIREHFGTAARDIPQFVNRAFAWFEMTSAE